PEHADAADAEHVRGAGAANRRVSALDAGGADGTRRRFDSRSGAVRREGRMHGLPSSRRARLAARPGSFADWCRAACRRARAFADRSAGRGAAAEPRLLGDAERRRADHRAPAEPRYVHRADHGFGRTSALFREGRARRARLCRIADAVLPGRDDSSGDRRSRELPCEPERRSDAMRMFPSPNKTIVLAAGFLACAPLSADVTFERILNADAEPHNWLSYSRTLSNQRYSPLDQINTGNVQNLELAWIWQARSLEKFEATALAVEIGR